MRWILLFFIVVPLLEMLLLFEVADRIGGLWTLFMVVMTAVIGVQILRWQGLSTLLRAGQRLQGGQLPAQEIIEGMLLAAAGALLLTPGFITDSFGFLLLTSPLRRWFAAMLIRSGIARSFSAGAGGGFYYSSDQGFGKDSPYTFEGTVVDKDEDKPAPDAPEGNDRWIP